MHVCSLNQWQTIVLDFRLVQSTSIDSPTPQTTSVNSPPTGKLRSVLHSEATAGGSCEREPTDPPWISPRSIAQPSWHTQPHDQIRGYPDRNGEPDLNRLSFGFSPALASTSLLQVLHSNARQGNQGFSPGFNLQFRCPASFSLATAAYSPHRTATITSSSSPQHAVLSEWPGGRGRRGGHRKEGGREG